MKTILSASFLFLLIACNDTKQAKDKPGKPGKVRVAGITNPPVKYGVEGYYTGAFEAMNNYDGSSTNKITICIDSLDDQNIYGHSVVAGNERPFWGAYKKDGEEYSATLREPGDDTYDG